MFGCFGSLGIPGSLGSRLRSGATNYATTWNFSRGDAEFAKTPWAALTRSGLGTRVNSSGLIESVSIPRIDHDPVTLAARGLLVEGQDTEKIGLTESISNAGWLKVNSPTIIANVGIAPDGTLSADSIQNVSGVAFRYVARTVTVPTNSTQVASVFVRKESSTIEHGGIAMDFQGGTRRLCYIAINQITGQAAVLSGSTISATIIVEDFDDYWRLSALATDTGANTSCSLYFYANISPDLVLLTTAGAGSARVIWGLNLCSSFGSHIPNPGTGTAVRAADNWYLSGAELSEVYAAAGWTWFADVTMTTSGTVMCLSDGTTTNQILVNVGAASIDLIAGASTIATLSHTYVAGERLKIAMSGDGSETVLAVGGSTNVGSAISSTIRNAISRGSICAVNGATMAATGVRTYRAASGAPVKKTAAQLAALTA